IDNQNSSEIVFAIQYSDGQGNGNRFNYIFAPLTEGADINPGTGLGMSRPTAELIRAYNENDTRMRATLSPYEINPNTSDTINQPYFRKFLADQQVQDGGQDWPILRYADILLLYAEVLNEMGDMQGALEQLNKVRSRAFEGDSENLYEIDMIANKSEMSEIILNERRLELACENHRWFDLLRFDKAEEFLQTEIRLQGLKTGIDLITYETSMNEYQRLYPIPMEQIELHNGILDQNKGY
ncbi:MAG TPA: RagB/SusD family nutrient uptake outer membrane protein, partial [Bacteroidales bacterium]|nr:RagB/SusD family nutrient uptake outer membrane protein [Bacteroidales bacterium]